MSWKDRLMVATAAGVIVVALVRNPWPFAVGSMVWGAATGGTMALTWTVVEPLRHRGMAGRVAAAALLMAGAIVPTVVLFMLGLWPAAADGAR